MRVKLRGSARERVFGFSHYHGRLRVSDSERRGSAVFDVGRDGREYGILEVGVVLKGLARGIGNLPQRDFGGTSVMFRKRDSVNRSQGFEDRLGERRGLAFKASTQGHRGVEDEGAGQYLWPSWIRSWMRSPGPSVRWCPSRKASMLATALRRRSSSSSDGVLSIPLAASRARSTTSSGERPPPRASAASSGSWP